MTKILVADNVEEQVTPTRGLPHPLPLQLQTEELVLVEVGGGLVDDGQLRLGVHQLLDCLRRIAKTDGCVDCRHCLELCSENDRSHWFFILLCFGLAQFPKNKVKCVQYVLLVKRRYHTERGLTSFLRLGKVIARADNSLNLLFVHHHSPAAVLQQREIGR